jgi:hypothetical protein
LPVYWRSPWEWEARPSPHATAAAGRNSHRPTVHKETSTMRNADFVGPDFIGEGVTFNPIKEE